MPSLDGTDRARARHRSGPVRSSLPWRAIALAALGCVPLLVSTAIRAAEPGEGGDVGPPNEPRIVVIDGRRWRLAPPGTSEIGPPDTRVVIDDRVYLDADRTPESFFEVPPAAEPPPSSDPVPDMPPVAEPEPTVEPPPSPDPVPDAPPVAGPEPADEPLPPPDPAPDTPPVAEPEPADEPPPSPDPVPDAPPVAGPERTEEPAPTPPPTDPPSARHDDRPDEGASPTAEMPQAEDPARSVERAPTATPAEGAVGDGALTGDEPDSTARIAPGTASPAPAVTDAGPEPNARRVAPPRGVLSMPDAVRTSSREFGYIDATSLSYERGGSGVMLEGSVTTSDRYRLLARIGAAAGYQELLLGASWYATPPVIDRLTLVLTFGIETGRFELERQGVGTHLSDTGLYFGGAVRLVVNGRLELQAGLGHGSFFESDPVAFGGAAFHVNSRLDIVSRFELGGNDTLGAGVRFYY